MPEALRGQYQSFTEAPMERLRAAGYGGQFTPLEEGMRRYVQDYLTPARPVSLTGSRMLPVLLFPQFDPVLLQLGPLAIRWYALAYIAGLVIGGWLVRRLVQRRPAVATPDAGRRFPHLGDARRRAGRAARLRAVLPAGPLPDPPVGDRRGLERRHEFHGGMLGVAVAIVWFCRRNRISDPRLRRPGRGGGADRAGPGPRRQFHQRRAVGARGAGLAALGDDLSGRRRRAAASEPDLSGADGGAAAVRRDAVAGAVASASVRATGC